jgi:uncharacterized protein YndB with AHSA1/START domain
MHHDIKKQVLLNSPQSRVWKALTTSSEFGTWFGMKLEGPFKAGETIKGKIAPTAVDPEVAKMQEPHAGKAVNFFVDRIEPESKFVIKWHPFAIDPNKDYSKEPMTLITFSLEKKEDGTLLTITEDGFDKIPESRRAEALKANDGGWAKQTELIQKYLARQN